MQDLILYNATAIRKKIRKIITLTIKRPVLWTYKFLYTQSIPIANWIRDRRVSHSHQCNSQYAWATIPPSGTQLLHICVKLLRKEKKRKRTYKNDACKSDRQPAIYAFKLDML